MGDKHVVDGRTEILWDDWGVPHIYAANDNDVTYGFGWAQARAHASHILQLYGIARGCAAEHWGVAYKGSDVLAWTIGLPRLGQQWWDLQAEPTRRRVEAFCAGVNAWFERHPESATAWRTILPVIPSDVFAHYARNLYHYAVLISGARTQTHLLEQFPSPPGSNAWAVNGWRSASGVPLMVCSPHLPWNGRFLLFEAHTVSPNRAFYGVTGIGLPWANYGFNNTVGWSHTVNPIHLFNVYQLTPDGEGYRFDDRTHAFATKTHELGVREANGEVSTETLTIRHSVHGPVLTSPDGGMTAVRIAGITVDPAVHGLEAWWAMSRARTVIDLLETVRERQLPLFTVIAADSDDNIAGAYAGKPPRRPWGSYSDWNDWLPGDLSKWLWYETHPQDDLPQLVNPSSGFVQSTNDPPWTLTWPMEVDPDVYSPAIAPPPGFPGFRTLGALEPLADAGSKISIEDLADLNFDTRLRMADHVLDDLVAAVRDAKDPDIRAAKKVLSRWDRCADADSPGTILFLAWVMEMASDLLADTLFAQEWSADAPFSTPRGLRDPQRCVEALAKAAAQLRASGKSLSATIGQEWRMKAGDHAAPADGGPPLLGALKALRATPDETGVPTTSFGYTFTAAVEFSRPVRAKGLLAYGNWTEPGSPETGGQLQLASQGRLRSIYLHRGEVEKHLWEREVL